MTGTGLSKIKRDDDQKSISITAHIGVNRQVIRSKILLENGR
jgi:hypothetical protein